MKNPALSRVNLDSLYSEGKEINAFKVRSSPEGDICADLINHAIRILVIFSKTIVRFED